MGSSWKLKNLNIVYTSEKKKLVTTMTRDAVITKSLIGKTLSIHNGQKYSPLVVTREHVGYKSGEFIFSRRYVEKVKKEKAKSK